LEKKEKKERKEKKGQVPPFFRVRFLILKIAIVIM
jgi:hypothetical protein